MVRRTTQSHWIRNTLVTIAIVLAVMAILVAGGLAVLNSQWALDLVESKLSEQVGRQVRIGSFELDLGQPIRVRIAEASVANPPWASTPYLATMEMLDMEIDAIELLGGEVLITDIQVTAPMAHLERSAHGQANWVMENKINPSPDPEAEEPSKDESAFDLPRIESLVVTGGRLTYSDIPKNISLALSLHSRNPESSHDQGLLVADGGGHIGGQPMTMRMSAESVPLMRKAEDNRVRLEVQIKALQTMMHIHGQVDALLAPETANLQFRIEGQNLSQWDEVLDMEVPALPTYQLAANLELANGVWLIDPMNTTIGDSDLTGSLRIITEADPLRIEGELSSKRLDVAQLQGYMPEPQHPDPVAVKAGKFLDLVANANWQAGLTYRADLIETDAVPIHDATMVVDLKNKQFTIESLSGVVKNMSLRIEAQVSAEDQPAEGRMRLHVHQPTSSEATSIPKDSDAKTKGMQGFSGSLEGEAAVNVQTIRQSQQNSESPSIPNDHHKSVPSVDLSTLAIQKFEIRYSDPPSNSHLLARIKDDRNSETLMVTADGNFHDKPVEGVLTVPSVESFFEPHTEGESRKQLSADLKLADSTVSVSAMVEPAWPPMWMDLSFSANSERPETIANLFKVDLPTVGKATLHGTLSKRGHTWRLKDFASGAGESDISGQATLDTTDEVQFKAHFHSNTLNVASLIPATGKETTPAHHMTTSSGPPERDSVQTPSGETLLPSWLTQLNGKIGLSVDKVALPGAAIKDVSVQMTMDAGLLRIAPLAIPLGGGTINTTAEMNLRKPSLSGTLRTDIQRVDLNEVMHTLGREAPQLGKVNGHLALSLPPTDQAKLRSLNGDVLLDRMHIDEVRLQYDDPDLQAKTDLRLIAENVESGIRVSGTVQYRETPMEVSLETGSIRQAIQGHGSMPVDASVKVKDTTIAFQASVGTLIPLTKFKGTFRVEGQDPAPLGEALGIHLPHLPPFRFTTQIHGEQGPTSQQTFHVTNLNGTIGDSDIAGMLRMTTGGKRPMVFARLRTDKLDLNELAGPIGEAPDPEETASSQHGAQAEASEGPKTLLPDKPIDFTKLQKFDADVEYRVKSILAPDLSLNDFNLDINLEDGRMQMNRLDFGVATGIVAIQLEVYAHESPVRAKLQTRFDHVNLSQLLARFQVGDTSFGDIGGQALLWMQGASLAKLFGSADGGLFLTMTGGKIDALLVELAGMDFTESAAVLVGPDTGVPIECAYIDMQSRSGIVTIHPLLMDTKDTKFKGQGKVDLRHETLNLTVEPYPKDFSLLSSRGPLHVSGTFMSPDFSVDPTFPSPEFGMARDSARCSGMVDALQNALKEQRTDKN